MVFIMEISKALQADITNNQQQLKLAIQNHQIMVLKQKNDPSNIQIKKEIVEVQKHIMSLGENQKHLMQRLRKELEACSTDNAAPLPLGLVGKNNSNNNNNSSNNINSNNNNIANNNNNNISKGRAAVRTEKLRNVKHKISRSWPTSVVSSSGSEDSQGLQETSHDSRMADKVKFLSAVGLVTREVLSELQNRRVERKRRSTANHSQFVYGNNWDVSKRKKNSYLMSGSTPNHHTTRQTTRAQRTDPPDLPVSSKPAPACSQTPEASTVPPPQCTTSRTFVPVDSNTPGSLRIPGLPESLTIERISSPQQLCIICRRIGDLSVCSNCSASYHPACLEDRPNCPQCTMKQDLGGNSSGQNSAPSCRAILQTYIGSHKVDLEEKKAEKLRLQQLNSQLTVEKELMEQRAAELTVSLASQDEYKKDLLETEEVMQQKIQRLHDFVTIIKTPRSATSS